MVISNSFVNYSRWNTEVYESKYHDFIKKEEFCNGIHVINLGAISLDLLLQGFQKKENEYCLVVFGGALSKKGIPPFFSGIELSKSLNLPLISLSDPSLSLSNDLTLSWYAGNHLERNLPEKISVILDQIFEKLQIKPILIGGSGGGFASLIQTSLLKTAAKTVVWNPQTSIAEYYPNHVINYLKNCFPVFKNEVKECIAISGPKKKKEILKLIEKIGLINTSPILEDADILYLQNISDKYHIENHFKPYFHSIKNIERLGVNSFGNLNGLNIHMGNWGEGHVPPSRDILVDIINKIIEGKSMSEIATKLSIPYQDQDYVPKFSLKEDIENDKINFKIIDQEDSRAVEVYLDNSKINQNLEYAIYFLKNGQKVKTVWYQPESIFELPSQDIDSISLFVKDFFGGKIQQVHQCRINGKLNKKIEIVERCKKIFPYVIGGDFQDLKKNGWVPRHDIKSIALIPPIVWKHSDNNVNFNLNAWRFMSAAWAFYVRNPSKENAEIAVDFNLNIMLDWYENSSKYRSTYTWYDMGVAFRSFHLGFLKFLISEFHMEISSSVQVIIDELINDHIIWLSKEENLGVGNHALYQVIALKTLCFIVNVKNHDDFCISNLNILLDKYFDQNSVSAENSPFYHFYNLNIIKKINVEIFDSMKDRINHIVKHGDLVTKWFTAPTKEFFRIGDTEGNGIFLEEKDLISSQVIDMKNNLCIYNDLHSSGYQIIRSHPKAILSPFAFIFYGPSISNVHQHCDGLSFIYYHNNIELFSDPGKYTYQYVPLRQWFASDVSHNTVGLESISYETVPLGNVKLSPMKIKEDRFTLEGFEIKSELINTRRKIEFIPNELIEIEDLVLNSSSQNTELRFLMGDTIFLKEFQGNVYIYHNEINEKPIGVMSFNPSPCRVKIVKREDGSAFISKKYNEKTATEQLLLSYSNKIGKVKTLIKLFDV